MLSFAMVAINVDLSVKMDYHRSSLSNEFVSIFRASRMSGFYIWPFLLQIVFTCQTSIYEKSKKKTLGSVIRFSWCLLVLADQARTRQASEREKFGPRSEN